MRFLVGKMGPTRLRRQKKGLKDGSSEVWWGRWVRLGSRGKNKKAR